MKKLSQSLFLIKFVLKTSKLSFYQKGKLKIFLFDKNLILMFLKQILLKKGFAKVVRLFQTENTFFEKISAKLKY